MKVEVLTFWLGCFLTTVIFYTTLMLLDRDYGKIIKYIEVVEEICKKHDSKPLSFDRDGTLTCTNGIEVQYTTGGYYEKLKRTK